MEKAEVREGNGHPETAETILQPTGNAVSSGPGTDDITGTLVGVGDALVAIHDKLRAIRQQHTPTKPTGKAA